MVLWGFHPLGPLMDPDQGNKSQESAEKLELAWLRFQNSYRFNTQLLFITSL